MYNVFSCESGVRSFRAVDCGSFFTRLIRGFVRGGDLRRADVIHAIGVIWFMAFF